MRRRLRPPRIIKMNFLEIIKIVLSIFYLLLKNRNDPDVKKQAELMAYEKDLHEVGTNIKQRKLSLVSAAISHELHRLRLEQAARDLKGQ